MKRIKEVIILTITIFILILLNNVTFGENIACEICLSYSGSSEILAGEEKVISVIAKNIEVQDGIVLYNGIIEYNSDKVDIDIMDTEEWEVYNQINNNITLIRKDLQNNKKNQLIAKIKITAKSNTQLDNIKLVKGEVTDGNTVYNAKDSILTNNAQSEINVEILEYTVKEIQNKKYICNVQPKTTMISFVNNIKTNGNIKLYKNGKEIEGDSTIIGTGNILKISLNTEEKEYTIISIADVNGDGKITGNDLLNAKKKIVGIISFNKDQELAADLNEDNSVTMTDILKIKRILVGL